MVAVIGVTLSIIRRKEGIDRMRRSDHTLPDEQEVHE